MAQRLRLSWLKIYGIFAGFFAAIGFGGRANAGNCDGTDPNCVICQPSDCSVSCRGIDNYDCTTDSTCYTDTESDAAFGFTSSGESMRNRKLCGTYKGLQIGCCTDDSDSDYNGTYYENGIIYSYMNCNDSNTHIVGPANDSTGMGYPSQGCPNKVFARNYNNNLTVTNFKSVTNNAVDGCMICPDTVYKNYYGDAVTTTKTFIPAETSCNRISACGVTNGAYSDGTGDFSVNNCFYSNS